MSAADSSVGNVQKEVEESVCLYAEDYSRAGED